MTLTRVVAGGQSGVDQGSLRAAKRAGLETGGWAPRLFLAELEVAGLDGCAPTYPITRCPWLANDFGLVECPEPAGAPPPEGTPEWRRWVSRVWPPRTRANARDSDGTVWLGPAGSLGYEATLAACRAEHKPWLVVPEGPGAGRMLLDWLGREGIACVNVAGSRESRCPGIGARAERFMLAVFRRAAQ